MQQGDVHHRIFAAERGVLHQNAEARLAQAANAGGDARVAVDDPLRHIGQADAVADDLELDVALENFRQGLGARLFQGVAGRHAVADVDIADHVDREQCGLAIAQAGVGNGANAALGIAGIEVDQLIGAHRFIGVIEFLQLGVQYGFRPGLAGDGKPLLVRVMHKLAFGDFFAEVEMRPEIIGAEALEKFAQRTRARGKLGAALAIAEEACAIAIGDMHRPDVFDFIEPGTLFNMKADRRQFAQQCGN